MESILEVRNICKSFGTDENKAEALQAIHF
ncbi:MAG: hypothetical protein K0R28_959 [Paenibacillus sp.]|jgi:hypothetical protein|nr:hypothetical protein [Paenibacillus sp.]